MGTPERNKKNYVMLNTTVQEAVENVPPGYRFEIAGQLIDFYKFKQWDDKSKDIAWGFAVALWRKRNDITAPTAETYFYAVDRFFEFKRQEAPDHTLAEINQELVNQFAYWVKYVATKRKQHLEPLSETSRRKIWGNIRDFLNELMRIGMVSAEIDLPSHIFNATVVEPFKRYSQAESDQILSACMRDIHAIRQKVAFTRDGKEHPAYLARLAPHALLITLRTGINPEVLFDMEVTEHSLQPSHLLNSTRLVLPLKSRSGHSQNVEIADDTVNGTRVRSNLVRLFKEVESITQNARDALAVNDPLRKKLWLVITENGRVDTFRNFNYYPSLQSFATRHQIKDHKGEITEINFRRFRPTFAEEYLKLNGGDVRDLQKRLGQQHLRTTMGYLDPNIEERKVDFKFAGTAMVNWALRSDNSQTTDSIAKDLNIPYDAAEKLVNGDFNMGVTKCKNPLESPLKGKKSGELCTEYLACFRCGNCVVLQEDSHRLFSFYHWLISKQSLLGHEKWKTTYGWIIDIIDKDIAPHLGSDEWIQQEKARAKSESFPMWPLQNIGEERVAS